MPVKITIIGLGQIGGSIGLSLAAHKDKVAITGHDREIGVEQRSNVAVHRDRELGDQRLGE